MAEIIWEKNLSAAEWDKYLASFNGHPLQSALWGDARQKVDGIESHRWLAFFEDQLVLMIRFEVRYIPVLGRLAWIPRGPVPSTHHIVEEAHLEFLSCLRKNGYTLCIEDPYTYTASHFATGIHLFPLPRTIWLDLRLGKEKLWAGLKRQWRYGIRVAERRGVVVEQSRAPADISVFSGLCVELSKRKHFFLPGSEALMSTLLGTSTSSDVGAELFIARYHGSIVAGVLVLRCGNSLHYFWGASNRSFSYQSPSEAVQWAVIEWACEKGIKTYDLEGIDPKKNPGVYRFKHKIGGVEITLPGKYAYPLNLRGRIALSVRRWLCRI